VQFVTLHTVLRSLRDKEHALIRRVSSVAQGVVVMSESSRVLLRDSFFVKERVEIIPHGVPRVSLSSDQRLTLREEMGWTNKFVLVSNGLIHPGKGYERVIRSMPKILLSNKVKVRSYESQIEID
jgi:glycosyltransferase involved in cell wall biosynthesis